MPPLRPRILWMRGLPLVCSIILVAGCINTPPEPATSTLPPTSHVAPVSVTPPPPTATATLTPAPSITPLPTSTPVPTWTPEPTLTPTPSDPVNPFTGLSITKEEAAHIPILIKVSNSPEVRPQTGLGLADVVMEHYAEGGITRYTALYLTNLPEKVGSVRSCRLIDIELVVIFGAGEVCSGTSGGVRQLLKQSVSWDGSGGVISKTVWMISDLGTFECRQQRGCKLPMFRTPDKLPPHNLYANAQNALKELQARGKNYPTLFNSWTFSPQPSSDGRATSQITIPYTAGFVTWKYDPSTRTWLRSIAGWPHVEKLTGKQLAASNVVVVYVNHVNTLIVEDVGGAHSIQIQLWGDGPISLFRDGQILRGRWQRQGNALGLSFVDERGHPLPLKPGVTWIEFVPLNMVVKTS